MWRCVIPAAVSKRQYRYMMAILHGKGGTSSRGDRVPKSVAGKFAGKESENLPESKGKAHEGGKWGETHHAADKKKVDSKRTDRKKKKSEDRDKKKKLNKAVEDFLIKSGRQGAGALVLDSSGRILLGRRSDTGEWSMPGGHVEPGESFEDAAMRELREEAGLVGRDPQQIMHHNYRGIDSKAFIVSSFKGKLKSNGEMNRLKWYDVADAPWDNMTDYSMDAIANSLKKTLTKTNELKFLVAYEELQKNIIRSGNAPANTVYELTHADAVKMVGNGTFRLLRDAVKNMTDEDFRDIHIDHYVLHIRKHTNDVYSGRVTDGHKQVHQFTNKSLPSVSAELMSVFEWYSPEDEKELEVMDESDMSDDAIEGGMNSLVEHYRKHNISSIYAEMENIREEIRNGMAVDLQQVEQKMMKLFDKLEETVMEIVDKHNDLTEETGSAADMLEAKLKELQCKIDEMGKQPVSVSAYSSSPRSDKKVHEEFYSFLPRPEVSISPDGHIKIVFASEWTPQERGNFLQDMRAKVLKRGDK